MNHTRQAITSHSNIASPPPPPQPRLRSRAREEVAAAAVFGLLAAARLPAIALVVAHLDVAVVPLRRLLGPAAAALAQLMDAREEDDHEEGSMPRMIHFANLRYL